MRKLDQAVWVDWNLRAEAEKKAAGKTDADLAAEVSELVGYEIKRALVNHWFRGRRDPSLREFLSLCIALGADPGYILLNVRVAYQKVATAPEVAQALRERATTPAYLAKSAKGLEPSAAKRKPKVRS